MTKKSILVVPHFDDEIFQVGGILLKYSKKINLVFTHPSDCIPLETYYHQRDMFDECLKVINDYRIKNGFNPIHNDDIIINEQSNFNGYMDSKVRRDLQKKLESLFIAQTNEKYAIDYFAYSVESSHQSHYESNKICNSLCRSPFIEKCKDIMLATYPQLEYGLNVSQKYANSYIPLDKEQAEILCYCIGKIYGEKNHNTTILGADNFKNYLQFFGAKCGNEFAQPFIAQRHIYTL